jgi:hypothetical protein
MKTCYLHLGMNKAGSTSIQHFFRDYADEKVAYLRLGCLPRHGLDNGNHSHHLEMRFQRAVPAHFFTSPDPREQRAERKRLREDFDRAVRSSPKSLVISGEVMFEWRNSRTKRNMANFLKARFEQLRGLVYVREPTSYMASLLQQFIQMRAPGRARKFENFYPRYRLRLKSWEAVLGRDNLEYVRFDQRSTSSSELLSDFATRTGMNPAWVEQQKHAATKRHNASLSAEATAVLLRYRLAHGHRPPHGPECVADTKLVSALMSFAGTHFSLGGKDVESLLEENKQDLRWIERRLGEALRPRSMESPDMFFSSWKDFSDYGASQGPSLLEWQRRAFPKLPVKAGRPEEILRHIRDGILLSLPPES